MKDMTNATREEFELARDKEQYQRDNTHTDQCMFQEEQERIRRGIEAVVKVLSSNSQFSNGVLEASNKKLLALLESIDTETYKK